jgi:hypothetical protein
MNRPEGYRGDPATGTHWAPLQPAGQPPPEMAEAFQTKGNTKTYGVSGTPITSGFIVDLGEYNALLMGRNAIPTYEQMRRSDGMVWSILQCCKLPILSAKWDVIPADDSSKAKEIAKAVKDNLFGGLEYQTGAGGWVSQTWSSVVRNALLQLDFGCAIHEDVWTVDGDKIKLRNLPGRLPLTYYRWHTDPDGETLTAIEQYGYRRHEFKNITLPAEKFCRFTYNQEGSNFWGIALQRPMYPSWFIKQGLIRVDAVACERNGLAIPTWKLSTGFNKEDRDAAFATVTQLAAHESAGAVEPPGDANTGLRLVGTTGSVRQIEPSLAFHNMEMARAALQMFSMSGTMPHGNRSTTSEHHDFFMLAEQALADDMGETFTNQTLRRFVEFNYGHAAVPLCPKLRAANVQARDIGDMTEWLEKLATAGLIVSEDNLRQFIREEGGLPEESDKGIISIKGETVTPEGQADTGDIAGKGAGGIESQRGPQKPQVNMYDLFGWHRFDSRVLALREGSRFSVGSNQYRYLGYDTAEVLS